MGKEEGHECPVSPNPRSIMDAKVNVTATALGASIV